MSQTPELPEAGGANLRRAIQHLPPHEPDPATWPRVAARLAADEALAHAMPALPAHEPDDALWARITARLDAAELPQPAAAPPPAAPAVVRTLQPAWRTRPVRRAMALVASVLLLLGIFWWQQRPRASALRETVAFSEEAAAPEPSALPTPMPGGDPLASQGVAFIDDHCTSLPTVCGSGEFRALRGQLAELETQQAQLQRDARRFGVSPDLRREQARLITLQASITRELVHLLIS